MARQIRLYAAGGLELVGWLADRTPHDVRLVQTYDPRDQRTPRGLRRQVFFMRVGDELEFVQVDVYGLERDAEVPQ